MNTYHLLWDPITNRLVIEQRKLNGYESQKTVRASCWIDAKKKLGFELTALQQEMLNASNAQNNSAKAGRRVVHNIEDARAKLRPAHRSLPDRGEAGEGSRDSLQQLLRDEGLLQDVRIDSDPRTAAEALFNL